MKTRAARLDALVRRLEGKLQKLNAVAWTLYERGIMRAECDAILQAFRVGDQTEVERIFFQDITPRSPEWRQLWAAYDATWAALAACGKIGPAFVNGLASDTTGVKRVKA